MKKILFVEGLSNHKGHILMNHPLLEILSREYEVHTLCFENWYQDLSPRIRQHYYMDVKPCRIRKLTRTFSALNILKKIGQLDKKLKFDVILMSTFSYWVTPVWKFYFPDYNKLWILHHDDLDLSRKFPYKLFFRAFVIKYVHLTLDPMIQKGMQKYYPDISERIFTVINPYRRLNLSKSHLWPQYEKRFLCVSIGNGADDSFIKEIIELEEKKHVLIQNEIFLYFKTTALKYNGANIIADPRYLTDSEYNGLLSRASALFVCYAKGYCLRLSGQLLDGLSGYKYVIGSNLPIIRAFSRRYPNICKIADSPEYFMKKVIELKNSPHPMEEFQCFFDNHSDSKILEQFREVWSKIMNETY